MTETFLTTRNSMLWWLSEPGGTLYPLSCSDLDSFEENANAIEVLRCWNADRSGWDIKGQTVAPAEKIALTVVFPRTVARSILETGDNCPGALIWGQKVCGRPDDFAWVQIGEIIQHVKREGRGFSGVSHLF